MINEEFNTALAFYESYLSNKNGRNTKAMRTRQKLARDGIYQTIINLVKSKDDAVGFTALVPFGIDYTFEAIVIRHARVFPADVVCIAENRLSRYKGIN